MGNGFLSVMGLKSSATMSISNTLVTIFGISPLSGFLAISITTGLFLFYFIWRASMLWTTVIEVLVTRSVTLSVLCALQVLCNLLSSGNSAVQHKCLCALEALALNMDAITHLKETTIIDILVDLIHVSRGKVNCRRRDKAGMIIKLLAGNLSHFSVYTS